MRILWLTSGLMALTLGIIGILLPLLPTVPFLLLAAFCFSKSSERLHHWLINHPKFGPPIMDWQSRGAITRHTKTLATMAIAVAFTIPIILSVRPMIIVIQALALTAVLTFIWTRPEA